MSKRTAILVVFSVIQVASAGHAWARETTRTGMSIAAGLEQVADASVTEADEPAATTMSRRGHLDASFLANVGDFAAGGVVAGSPGIFGDGRLIIGGRAGWQPTFGTTRLQILGDAGIHRFTDAGAGFFSSTTPDVISTPYVGLQVGMTRSFWRDGHLEYGIALLARHDLRTQSATKQGGTLDIFGTGEPAPPPTVLNVGGTMVGVSLTIGFRFELPRAHVAVE